MRFEISAEPTFDELKAKLTNQFPQYELSMRGKHILIVKKSATLGTNILVSKKKMIVNGNFPTMGGQIIFTLVFILLGIIIPIIIYFLVFHKKFKAYEKEIGGFLESEYGVK